VKIVFLLKSFAAGGVERITLVLGRMLVQRGHDVTLAVFRNQGPLAQEVPPEVRLQALEPSTSIAGRALALRSDPSSLTQMARPVLLAAKADRTLRYLPGLRRLLREEQPDAIVAAMPYVNLVALWARGLARTRSRLLVMEHIEISQYLAERKGWRHQYLLPLIRRSYPKADIVGAVSRGVAEDLARSSGIDRELVRVLYNPVVTGELRAMADQPVEHPWFRTDAPPVVLNVGRLAEQKDHVTLLRAFAKVRAIRPARLVILGSAGTDQKTAERQSELMSLARDLGVEHDVSLPGFVSNPYAFMAKASVFVLSSRYEGLPTVLVEAMACGCPVVSTACPGSVEILEEGRYGTIAPIGDVEALAQSIVATLDSNPDQEALRQRSLDFSAERSVAHYESLLAGREQ
jgi:glycosyltransferase involved in cell wall biosynthesis